MRRSMFALLWAGPLFLALAVRPIADAQAAWIDRRPDVVLVSGDLVHHRLTNELFHIDRLWFRVTPNTELHRWLLAGAGRHALLLLTANPDAYGDDSNVRMFPGRLAHAVAPYTRPMTHAYHVADPETGRFGPITLETTDLVLVGKFAAFEDARVTLVVRLFDVD